MISTEKLTALLKKSHPKVDIIGIRGLVKTKESEYSFRFTYREKDDDFLSISDIVKYDFVKKKFIDKKYYGKSMPKKVKTKK